MDDYESLIAEIDRSITTSGQRINGLANNVNRAINRMTGDHPDGLTAPERDVLLSFEALCIESLWRTAWLLHQRHEQDSARHCLEVGRQLQDAVEAATRGA